MKTLVLTGVIALTGANYTLADEARDGSKDLSKLTCGEFIQMPASDAMITLFWVDGYLSHKSGNPVFDSETFVDHRDKLVTLCTADEGKEKLVIEEVEIWVNQLSQIGLLLPLAALANLGNLTKRSSSLIVI